MPLQQILFYISTVLFVLAGLSAAGAVFVFFAKHVMDVRADLSGKKRQQAIDTADVKRQARDRRRSAVRRDAHTGGLTGELAGDAAAAQAPVQEPAATWHVAQQPAADAPAGAQEAPVRQASAVAAVAQGAVGASLESAEGAPTVILPDDDSSTAILAVEDGGQSPHAEPEDSDATVQVVVDDAVPAHEDAAGQADNATMGFRVGKKIFLTDSAQYVTADKQ